jgi:hypothetical protein
MKKLLALLLISFIIFSVCVATGVNAANVPFTALGTVVDRHGHPVSGATVTLINDNWQELGRTTSDSNGNFGFTNVPPGTSNLVKVKVSLTESGKTYQTEIQNVLWYDTSAGIVKFDLKDTTLFQYPPPEYGYIWGVMQTDGANPRSLGNGAVYVKGGASDQTYYSFTSNGAGQGKGTFLMHLPIGHYRVYGQYMENGMIFQSKPYEVDVYGATQYTESNALTISVPTTTPATSAWPEIIPGVFTNTVSGKVTTRDNKPLADATVTLWQSADDITRPPTKKAEARTDVNGVYQFYDVRVTSDPPDGSEIFGMKKFTVSTSFTDPEGNTLVKNESFNLYHPNVLFGIGKMEESARNVTIDLQFDYARSGWIEILCDPQGAKVFVDNQPLIDPETGEQYVTPCTPYIDPGTHIIKLSAEGYEDKTYPVNIKENMETQSIVAHLSQPAVPAWVTLAVVVIILLIVVIVILVLLASKRHVFLGPLAGVLSPLKKSVGGAIGNAGSSSEAKKAHKARLAEMKRAEQANRAMINEPHFQATQPKLDAKKPEHGLSLNTRMDRPGLPEYRGEDEVASPPSAVSAREIYRKKEQPGVERVPHSQHSGAAQSGAAAARHPVGHDQPAEQDGRIRIPRAKPAAATMGSTMQDKERVIRYIREHSDGVSFIQMSNDLEIQPNTLTIITKELVINDDIEKVKGLYYFKSHVSQGDDSKSSVVVWRLDGDE